MTSSDSGSLVIVCLSANGNPEPPIVPRIFCALTSLRHLGHGILPIRIVYNVQEEKLHRVN